MRASLETRGQAFATTTYFLHAYIYLFTQQKFNDENDGTIGFLFCTQKTNMKRTRPYLLEKCHHLPRDSYWSKY